MDEIDNAVLQLIEDFLFADAPLEESALFSEIEHIKSDDLELSQAEYLIESLAQRRKLNEHLKNRNPFTVWRILNYVRKHNIKNEDVQSYLDIYYNLDRYVNSGLEWDSGYYLSESDYERNESFINSYPSLSIILVIISYTGKRILPAGFSVCCGPPRRLGKFQRTLPEHFLRLANPRGYCIWPFS